jgi:hypothetical protein
VTAPIKVSHALGFEYPIVVRAVKRELDLFYRDEVLSNIITNRVVSQANLLDRKVNFAEIPSSPISGDDQVFHGGGSVAGVRPDLTGKCRL